VAEQGGRQDPHKRIGERLRGARLAAGLTARQVGDSTRITIDVLHRVEAGEFAECGGDIYARGHIRAYALAVGLDPEPLLADFGAVRLPPLTKRDLRKPRVAAPPARERAVPPPGAAQRRAAAQRARSVLPTIVPGAVPSLVPMAGTLPPPELPPLKQERREDFTDADAGSAAVLNTGRTVPAVNRQPSAFLAGAKPAGRGGPNWTLALIGAIVAIGLLAVIQLWPSGGGAPAKAGGKNVADVNRAPAHTGAQVAAAAKNQGAQPPAAPGAPPTHSTSPMPTAPVDVKVVAAGDGSWLGVTNSAGQQLYWNVLQPGQSREFTDGSRIDVIFGNAAAVDVTVNGRDLGPQGGTGQVFRGSYSKDS
jgi:transcriptional regulator with XRE-family HTH domain